MAKHFAVVKMDQLGKLSGGAGVGPSLDDAVISAMTQTSGDKEPRYVVQVLRLVEGLHNDELSRFSQALTRHWQNLAYGHRLPPENLKRGICEAWRRLFAQERRA